MLSKNHPSRKEEVRAENREYQRHWRTKNPEQAKLTASAWRKNNPIREQVIEKLE